MSWVGRPMPRLEDPVLLTGHGRFIADVAQGAAAVRFVRSPIARGRIVGIEHAGGSAGGRARDHRRRSRRRRPIRPLLHRPDYVPIAQPMLAGERVNYVGEPIAAVIAPTPREAEDIAELVFVDIEPEDAVVDLDAALAPGRAAGARAGARQPPDRRQDRDQGLR